MNPNRKVKMIDAAQLKQDPERLYAFKSPLKARWVKCLDSLGGIMFGRSLGWADWSRVEKVAVLRLDHLGDVLLALPSVRALEEALPHAQVDFFVGPWAEDILKSTNLRVRLKVFTAGWFNRSLRKTGTWTSILELGRLLRDGGYDAVIDLRGDSRHILAAYLARVRERIGCSRSGLGFLLNRPVPFRPGVHEAARNLDILKQAGIRITSPAKKYQATFKFSKGKIHQVEAVKKKFNVSGPLIAIHALGSTRAKRWPPGHWSRLINALPDKMNVVLIGTEDEKEELDRIRLQCERKVHLAAGLFDLPSLAFFLKGCRLFIGVDSGPAHIAAATGIPVIVLFSGTNVAAQWAPLGDRVIVLQKTPPCSPCERTDCPFDNECMRLIGPDEVSESVRRVLRSMGFSDGRKKAMK